MSGHELNYNSIAVSKPNAGSGAAVYIVSLRCMCGSQLRGSGTSYVEASQKLHAAFAAHEKETSRRPEFVR